MNLNFGNGHHFQPKPDKYCEIGRAINAKLSERNLSRNQFAKQIGISPSYLCHIMRGHYNDSPKIPIIFKELGI